VEGAGGGVEELIQFEVREALLVRPRLGEHVELEEKWENRRS
jgi:hypothetical protein